MISMVFNYTQACTQNLKCISLLVSIQQEKIATHVKHHKNGNTKLEVLCIMSVKKPNETTARFVMMKSDKLSGQIIGKQKNSSVRGDQIFLCG